jgi:hypothetical protein
VRRCGAANSHDRFVSRARRQAFDKGPSKPKPACAPLRSLVPMESKRGFMNASPHLFDFEDFSVAAVVALRADRPGSVSIDTDYQF